MPIIKIKDLQNGRVLDSLDRIFIGESQHDRYRVAIGDVLLANRGTIFRSAVVDEKSHGSVVSSNLFFIRLNGRKLVLPEVLQAFFESSNGEGQLRGISRAGTTRLVLSANDLVNLVIPVPPMESQCKLAEMVQASRKAYDLELRAADARAAISRNIIDHLFERSG